MTKAYTVADWHQANVNIATDAATQRFDSNATKVRQYFTIDSTYL